MLSGDTIGSAASDDGNAPDWVQPDTVFAMSKRTRGKKASATRPRRRRADRPTPPASPGSPSAPGPEERPELLSQVAEAVAEDHPLGLLMMVSALLASLEPAVAGPFDPEPDPDVPSRDDLVGTFIDVDLPETTTLLAVIGDFVDDEMLRRRVRREVRSRTHALPRWLSDLPGTAAVESAFEAVHVLGDAHTIAVGVRWPGSQELSVMVYVDHNLGTVVKDVIATGEPVGALAEQMGTVSNDPDITVRAIDPADARARVEDAVHTGSLMFPPIESDSWPAARPLVEWVLRRLPAGGTLPERPQWDDEALRAVTERFVGSRFGRGFDDGDHRALLESLLWFGTDYGPGDPLRWSPSAVEIVLVDWIPRKIVADVDYLAKAPDLLRAWIRFCHQERGVRPSLTDETLAAVDDCEPEYQQTIRSPRPQGPAALLAAMGMPWSEALPDLETIMLEYLRRAVGGEDALEGLDTDPLPDEPFDWTSVPDDVVGRVGEVLALVEGGCEELFDRECRTACRRLLARAVAGDPEIVRRRGRADTLAAATCWIVGKANRLFEGGGMAVKDLAAHFRLASGTVSQRARVLLAAVGVESTAYQLDLGSPEYLTSRRRTAILADRNRYRAVTDY